MPRPRSALAVAVTALALTACTQPTTALDNTNPRQDQRTITEPTIIRSPVRVPTAPPTVPLPGPTGGAPGEEPELITTFSPGPDGEGVQADEGGGSGGS